MSGQSQTQIRDDKYLLVSDSNEIGGQYDSKKLSQATLVELAEEDLFKKHLDIMSSYLTTGKFNTYKSIINEQLNIHRTMYDQLGEWEQNWHGKLKVVDGQVILIKMSELDKYNSWLLTQDDKRMTPIEYLKLHWDIPSDYTVEQISDCMLRGVTEVNSISTSEVERGKVIKRQTNINVDLTKGNIPTHMHHSGITTGAGIECMEGALNVTTKRDTGQIRYDMFYNDSFSTGVDKNELDGVVDEFSVQDEGSEVLSHNNMPVYDTFYAFVVRKHANE